MSTILYPADGMALLTALHPADGMSLLTSLHPKDGMAFLRAPDPTEGIPVAFLTTPDPKAGPVEVGHPLVPAEVDLNLCPNYHVGAADWSRVTAMSLDKPTSQAC